MNLFEMKSFAENYHSKTAQRGTTLTYLRLEIKKERWRKLIHDRSNISVDQGSCFEVLNKILKYLSGVNDVIYFQTLHNLCFFLSYL